MGETYTRFVKGEEKWAFEKLHPNGQDVPRPEVSGVLKKSVGFPKSGQKAHWRASFENKEEGFHVVEFEDHYVCHIDRQDPAKKPLAHLIEDSPETILIVGILMLAVGVTYYLFRR